jgi:MYXO-CTERM domain-containing protein
MSTPQGQLCVPADCSIGGCPPGGVCKNNICVPACTGVVCPGTQECQDGVCKDLCANKACPAGQVCQHGTCEFLCSCFAGNIGCMNQPGTNCDSANGGVCVPPACVGSKCVAPETCDPQTGQCVPFCNSKVACPNGEKCVDPTGCVPNCQGVTCQTGFQCDPKTGNCVDKCQNVNCLLPDVCKDGMCVPGGTGGAGGQGGGSSTQSSASAGGQGGGTGHVTKGNGCGCRTAGDDSEDSSLPLGIAAVGAFFALRRARRSGRR